MDNEAYKRQKLEYAYSLYKNKQFFKKARAIVVEDRKVLLIEVRYLNGFTDDLAINDNRKNYDKHYLLPGGGVDDNETIKQAVIREALEEYGVNVEPIKYFGKSYYTVPMNKDGIEFKSNRVEYFYLCKVINDEKSEQFGIDGEFSAKNKVYKKVKLTLEEIMALDPSDLNDMNKKTYDMLVEYLRNNK